jgi:hypothetical protein
MNNFASSTCAPCRKLPRHSFQIVGLPVLAAVGIWALSGFAAATAAEARETSTLGDSSGYLNSLFSTLALVGVIIAIVLQIQELKLQREELRATHEEMNRSISARQKIGGSRTTKKTKRTICCCFCPRANGAISRTSHSFQG